jgi:hypothetical protein
LTKISSGDIPIPLVGKARIIFHLIPYSAFESSPSLSFATIEDIWSIPLMYTGTSGYRYSLDGLMVYSEKEHASCSEGYTQVFRNGIIEAVNTSLFGAGAAGSYLPSLTFETDITAFLDACLAFYKKFSIRMPAILFVSLTGTGDWTLTGHRHLDRHTQVNRIDRDSLLLPEVIVENVGVHSATVLKPVFHAVSSSIGWERLYGYSEPGKKGLLFPTKKFASKESDLSQGDQAKRH